MGRNTKRKSTELKTIAGRIASHAADLVRIFLPLHPVECSKPAHFILKSLVVEEHYKSWNPCLLISALYP